MNDRASTGTKANPGWFRRCLDFALTLGASHTAIAVALMPILGGWTILYAIFPPYLLYIVRDGIATAPLFATLAFGTGLSLAPMLRRSYAWCGRHLPPRTRPAIAAALVLWIPIACGEGVRWTLMHSQLTRVAPRCHDTRSLIASLRQRYGGGFDESREPHAWMIRGERIWLWSYRTLRFEPAPAWTGAEPAPAECYRPGRPY